MDDEEGSLVARVIPGPIGCALWIGATVPAPLLVWEGLLRWEEDISLVAVLLGMIPAVCVLAGVMSARLTVFTGRRRTASAFFASAAIPVTAGFVALSTAVFTLVMPLGRGNADLGDVLLFGCALPAAAAFVGAVSGYLLGLAGVGRRIGLPVGVHYVIGGLVAVGGALLAPVTLQLGAEDSTVRYDTGRYGGVGPHVSSGASSAVRLPRAGSYAIYGVDSSPTDPDCRVAGSAAPDRRAELVTVPPSDYGSDAATYAWVASFDVRAAGTYTLSCLSSNPKASYTVGDVPEIRGAVRFLIHAPLPGLWLLGALPGLVILAHATRRHGRKRSGIVDVVPMSS
jgi:hypothetical protein